MDGLLKVALIHQIKRRILHPLSRERLGCNRGWNDEQTACQLLDAGVVRPIIHGLGTMFGEVSCPLKVLFFGTNSTNYGDRC